MSTFTEETIGSCRLVHADCLDVLRTLEANSIDAIVTDPPYGLEFMGKEWDAPWRKSGDVLGNPASVGGFQDGNGGNPFSRSRIRYGRSKDLQEWHYAWAENAIRVLKPGAHCLAFGGDRTIHRLMCALEDAGFEIRGQIAWIHGQGFPKNLNVSQAFLSLPWCTCGSSQKTSSGAIQSIPTDKSSATLGTDPGIALKGCSASTNTIPCVDTLLPSTPISTGSGTISIPSPSHRMPADDAQRLGNQSCGSTRHRQSTVQQRIQENERQFSPVMFGPFSMTNATQSQEIGLNIGSIQVEPKPLGDEMMRDEILITPTVKTNPVPFNNSSSDMFPSDSLIRPLPATPSGVFIATEPPTIINSHTSTGAIDRIAGTNCARSEKLLPTEFTNKSRQTALEFSTAASFEHNSLHASDTGSGTILGNSGSGLELDAAVGTLFGKHEAIIRALISENKVFICPECRHPLCPPWIYEGIGSALKPAMELIVVARKPLSESTVATNVLKHGTGALNIQACRIPHQSEADRMSATPQGRATAKSGALAGKSQRDGVPAEFGRPDTTLGRWPANLILDGSESVLALFPEANSARANGNPNNPIHRELPNQLMSWGGRRETHDFRDTGSAARFFFCAKTSPAERDGSIHPTMKPISLMRWLVRLVTPPGGLVCDPFLGSGTTALACLAEGMRCLGIEREAEYIAIARKRLLEATRQGDLFSREKATKSTTTISGEPQCTLFPPSSAQPIPHRGTCEIAEVEIPPGMTS